MATGPGLGGMVSVLLPLVGIVTILKARAARRRGTPPVDEDFEKRRAATLESERRMAAYLAQLGSGGYHVQEDERENGR